MKPKKPKSSPQYPAVDPAEIARNRGMRLGLRGGSREDTILGSTLGG